MDDMVEQVFARFELTMSFGGTFYITTVSRFLTSSGPRHKANITYLLASCVLMTCHFQEPVENIAYIAEYIAYTAECMAYVAIFI